MSNKAISVYAEALKRKEIEENGSTTREPTLKVTWESEISSNHPREEPRISTREKSRELPNRDEIQEFTFRLRDELKVKVQAEVPHPWQKELEEIARELDVKKLELYRFILGEFLGKVRREKPG
jgi:signal recognition particle subunit SEC65